MTSKLNTNQEVDHPHRWEPGEKIHHFTILNFIASEPLGDNYLAKDTQLNRMVALKRFAFNVELDYSIDLVEKLKKKFLDNYAIVYLVVLQYLRHMFLKLHLVQLPLL